MSHALTHDHVSPFAASPAASRLRRRIGWICQAFRIAAVVWIVWIFAMDLLVWGNKATVLQAFSQWLAVDVTGVSTASYAVAFALVLVAGCAGAVVALCLWQLAATYLAGRVFTIDAALWLRRTGLAAVAAVAVTVVIRILVVAIFTGQVILFPPHGFIVLPQDLLNPIFAAFVLALAHIFKAAAEMADDHAQIV